MITLSKHLLFLGLITAKHLSKNKGIKKFFKFSSLDFFLII